MRLGMLVVAAAWVGLLACDGPSSTTNDVTGAPDGTIAADGTIAPDGVDDAEVSGPEAGAETAVETIAETVEETGPTRTGLEANCDRYVECGGTYYESAQACIDATLDYWGDCYRPELDVFGDCMAALSCDDWGNPDGYIPSETPCAEQWEDVLAADCK